MKYQISYSNKFKKSLKKCFKRGLDIEKLKKAVDILEESGSLPAVYRPHKLVGRYAECWECHIEPDWLLVWKQNDIELILMFIDTGTHADLF